MNIWDLLILAVVGAAVVFAVRHIVRGKGGGCNGSCASCRKQCVLEDTERKK